MLPQNRLDKLLPLITTEVLTATILMPGLWQKLHFATTKKLLSLPPLETKHISEETEASHTAYF